MLDVVRQAAHRATAAHLANMCRPDASSVILCVSVLEAPVSRAAADRAARATAAQDAVIEEVVRREVIFKYVQQRHGAAGGGGGGHTPCIRPVTLSYVSFHDALPQ